MSAAGYAAGTAGEGEAAVAGGPGTSQEGEALALIEYVIALAGREGVYWIIGDSEAAVGALRKYQQGVMSGDGMGEFYAQRLGSEILRPTSAINIVVTPSHWVTSVNIRVDQATAEQPTVDLSRALRRAFAFAPSGKYLDHYQLVPRVLLGWLRSRASEESDTNNQGKYGEAWNTGRGLRMV